MARKTIGVAPRRSEIPSLSCYRKRQEVASRSGKRLAAGVGGKQRSRDRAGAAQPHKAAPLPHGRGSESPAVRRRLLLHLDVVAGGVEGLDQLRRVEVAGDLEGIGLGL